MSDTATWWKKRARRLARRVNAGWWLDVWLPSTVLLSSLAAAAVLLLRRLGRDPEPAIHAYVIGLTLAGLVSYGLARRRFYSQRDGLIRIEGRYRLHNRLSAADDGVGDWPASRPDIDHGLQLHWPRFVSPPLLSVALVLAAWWIPMQVIEAFSRPTPAEPVAWRQVDEWLQTIEEQNITEDESLRELQEKLEHLRSQPKNEWYQHSSLEAGDSLRDQARHQLQEFQRNLESAMAAVSSLEQMPNELSEAMKERWNQHLQKTLEGFQSGELALDEEWLSKLESLDIDPSKLRPLTEEEMKRLKEALAKGLESCQECTGKGTNDVLVLVQGLCQAGGTGVQRGPGTRPLSLSANASELGTTGLEMMQNEDFSRAAIGDTLAVREIDHEVDETAYQGPVEAGAVVSVGQGGETVWKQNLMPDERDVLQEYFQ